MDCNLPGSSVRGISQARILEWVAISSFPSPGDLPNPGKISVQISLQDSPFNSFRYIFRIAGSYGNSVFNFWRSCQIAFHRGYTTLHSHQQCTRDPFSPHSHQHLLFSVFCLFVCLFYRSPPNRCEMEAQISFTCKHKPIFCIRITGH